MTDREFSDIEVERHEYNDPVIQAMMDRNAQVVRDMLIALRESQRELRALREDTRMRTKAFRRAIDELKRRGPGGEAAAT